MSDPHRVRLPSTESSPSGNADAGRMLQILWRGRWILLVVPLLVFGAASWWLARQTPLYLATAQIQVDAREVNPLKSELGSATNKARTILKQQQQLLRSSAILKPLSESPELLAFATFAPERLGDKPVISELFDGLTITVDPESDRLIITFLCPYPDESGRIVEKTVELYLDHHRNEKREQAQLSYEILRGIWESTKAELAATTAKIADLRSRNHLAPGMTETVVERRLEEAYAAWNAAHLTKLKEQATWESLTKAQEDVAELKKCGEYWRQTRPIQTLESEIEYAIEQRQAAEKRFERSSKVLDEANPELAQLRAEIAAFAAQEDEIILQYARDYMRNAERSFQDAERQERLLEADVASLEEQIYATNRVLEEIADHEMQRQALRETIGQFEERMSELQVEDQVGALNLHVLEAGRVALRPAYPDVKAVRLYSVAGGALLAFVLVVLGGFADRRIRDPEEVPATLGASVLGVVPALSGSTIRARVGRVVEEEPQSLAAEAIRSLRTATSFALPENGRGIVLVTSAVSGEGKSVSASNLAFALARAGRRTLLVDGDMRKPAQHAIYDVPNEIGLGNLLSSRTPLKKAIVPNVAAGLDLLPAGDAAGRPAELCEGAAFPELLATLCDQYEILVVDAPSVLETSEARVIASYADAVVLVMRLDVTTTSSAQRAAGILRGVGAKLAGVLLVGARSGRDARAYAGGISHGILRRPRAEGEAGPVLVEDDPGDSAYLGLEERA